MTIDKVEVLMDSIVTSVLVTFLRRTPESEDYSNTELVIKPTERLVKYKNQIIKKLKR